MENISKENIRHFKLSSGQEIVSFVIPMDQYLKETDQEKKLKIDESMIILKNPLLINISVLNNVTSSYFTKWQPMAINEFCFVNTFHIISHVECNQFIKEKYIEIISMPQEENEEAGIESDSYDEDDDESNTITPLRKKESTPKKILH
jgi:hypothetical protein